MRAHGRQKKAMVNEPSSERTSGGRRWRGHGDAEVRRRDGDLHEVPRDRVQRREGPVPRPGRGGGPRGPLSVRNRRPRGWRLHRGRCRRDPPEAAGARGGLPRGGRVPAREGPARGPREAPAYLYPARAEEGGERAAGDRALHGEVLLREHHAEAGGGRGDDELSHRTRMTGYQVRNQEDISLSIGPGVRTRVHGRHPDLRVATDGPPGGDRDRRLPERGPRVEHRRELPDQRAESRPDRDYGLRSVPHGLPRPGRRADEPRADLRRP